MNWNVHISKKAACYFSLRISKLTLEILLLLCKLRLTQVTLSCPKNTPYYSANCVRQTTAPAEIVLLNVRQSLIIISVLQCLWFREAELEDSVRTEAQSLFLQLKHKRCAVPERCKEYLRSLSSFIQLILFDRSNSNVRVHTCSYFAIMSVVGMHQS